MPLSRRGFLSAALKATAAGILVPEWLLDPLKGRSMVAVPSFSMDVLDHLIVPEMMGRIALLKPSHFPLALLMQRLGKVNA